VLLMRPLLLLLSLIIAIATAFWLTHDIGWASLAQHQGELLSWVRTDPFQAAGAYVLVYVLTTALSMPHAALLTVAGGLMFGPVLTLFLTSIGSTTGATLLVLALRSILAETRRRQRRRIPETVRQGLERNGMSYLLFVRVLPLFPFWVVNLAAAVVDVRIRVFVPATLIGVLPMTYVLASIGAGIGNVLASGHRPDLMQIFQPHILLPLAGLASLSLIPVLLRRRSPDQLQPD
jgi:uncharacterized membrane protein YdjX (TVP38/TMEM64 family)